MQASCQIECWARIDASNKEMPARGVAIWKIIPSKRQLLPKWNDGDGRMWGEKKRRGTPESFPASSSTALELPGASRPV
jgi:hypothetical protein